MIIIYERFKHEFHIIRLIKRNLNVKNNEIFWNPSRACIYVYNLHGFSRRRIERVLFQCQNVRVYSKFTIHDFPLTPRHLYTFEKYTSEICHKSYKRFIKRNENQCTPMYTRINLSITFRVIMDLYIIYKLKINK